MDYKKAAIVTTSRTDTTATTTPTRFLLQNSQHQRRIAVFGSKACGKTAFCVRYVEARFLESYYPTIRENQFMKLVRRRDDGVGTVELLDTAGQNSVRSLLRLESSRVAWLDGIVLCYSVDDRRSFEMVKVIWDEFVDMLMHYYRDIGITTLDSVWFPPVLVVGNKVDLRGKVETAEVPQRRKEVGERERERRRSDEGNGTGEDISRGEKEVMHSQGITPERNGKKDASQMQKSQYIGPEEGQDLVVEIQREIRAKYNLHHISIDFIECSSKHDYQVTAAMQLLLRKIETLLSNISYSDTTEETLCSIV